MKVIQLNEFAKLECFVDDYSPDQQPSPALLILPGGGYGCICYDTEGKPMVERFSKMGLRCFVLHYRVGENQTYPEALRDGVEAIQLIRKNAAEWGVIPENLAVVGFSAGGHLAAALGTLCTKLPRELLTDDASTPHIPNAMLLSFAVLSGSEIGHVGSMKSFFHTKELTEEQKELFSLEKQITDKTPPAFLWATVEDQVVPFENSSRFHLAMVKAKRTAELHVYPVGVHGMQFGYGRNDIVRWPEQAVTFLKDTCGFKFPSEAPKKRIVLSFDDAVVNHCTFVAPVLKKYGFNATFFISGFDKKWYEEHNAENLMTPEQIRSLHEQGFEIGNHTATHNMGTKEECEKELDAMTEYLTKECGVPAPISFAYPGGPYSDEMAAVLKERGYKYARTCDERFYQPAADDPLKVPAFNICYQTYFGYFSRINKNLPSLNFDENVPVFVFHGIPDVEHPWVNMDPYHFEHFIAFLAGNGYQGIAFKDL